MTTNQIATFDRFIKKQLSDCLYVPGMAVSLFNSDEIIYKNIFGYANVENKRKLKFTDKFCIGSCSKSIFCLAITLAINNEEIPNIWEMNIGDIFKKIHSDHKNVPIKYLASHTSGINDFHDCSKKNKMLVNKFGQIEGMKSRNLVAKYILNLPSLYIAGTKRQYSNVGYGILGAIIEKLTKQKYIKLIEKYIFKSLCIESMYPNYSTGIGFADGHGMSGLLDNYKFVPLKKLEHILYEEPAGSIYINILDSTKYLQQYLNISSLL